MKATILTGTAVVLLASALCGQSIPLGGLLVSNIAATGPTMTLAGYLYTQDIGTCGTAMRRSSCLAWPVSGAGGTAYDTARQAVWVSDGAQITLKNIVTGTQTCTFKATLTTGGKGNFVAGLAHSNRRRQLIQLEMLPATATGSSLALRFYDTKQCPPTLLPTTCTYSIPRGNVPGVALGLAYDEARDLIFFSTSLTGIAGTSSSLNYINYSLVCLPGVNPTVINLPRFANCGGSSVNSVSGLAYDSCSQIMYVTEGTVVLQMGLKNLGSPVNLNATKPCCQFGVANRIWAGLAFVPKSSEKPVGTSCLNSGCATCNTMKFDIVGDLALGNQNLTLQVDNAPTGGSASLYLSVGQCLGTGISLPVLCGPIFTPVSAGQPMLAGIFPLGGTGGSCNGLLQLTMAIPPNPSLCNLVICTQCLILCPGGSGGAGLTNAIEFKIGS